MAYIDLVEFGVDPEHAVYGLDADNLRTRLAEPCQSEHIVIHPLELTEPSIIHPPQLLGTAVLALS
jgi:hypothetical protein